MLNNVKFLLFLSILACFSSQNKLLGFNIPLGKKSIGGKILEENREKKSEYFIKHILWTLVRID